MRSASKTIYIPWGNVFFSDILQQGMSCLRTDTSTELYSLAVPKQPIPRYCSSRYEAPLASLELLHNISRNSEKKPRNILDYSRIFLSLGTAKLKQLKFGMIISLYLNIWRDE